MKILLVLLILLSLPTEASAWSRKEALETQILIRGLDCPKYQWDTRPCRTFMVSQKDREIKTMSLKELNQFIDDLASSNEWIKYGPIQYHSNFWSVEAPSTGATP